MKSGYVILREKKDDYFLKSLDFNEIYNVYSEKKQKYGFMFKVVSRLFPNMLKFFFGDWANDIQNKQLVIIFDAWYNKEISRYIKKNNPNCTILMYFWNKITDENKWILSDEKIDKFITFDSKDSEKYNLFFNPQFYSSNIHLDNVPFQYDVVFLGRGKNRSDDIGSIRRRFRLLGLKCKFLVVKDENDYVDYYDYLKIVSTSKAILDFSNNGQSGLSLRCMEGIFLGKKIITNNVNVKKYDFYSDDNFFILQYDDERKLRRFVDKRPKRVPKTIVENYSFEKWLERMKEIA